MAAPDMVDVRATSLARDSSLLITTLPTSIHCFISEVKTNAGRVVETMVERFLEGGTRRQLSDEAGRSPVWSRDGKTLYYVAGDSMMAVAVRSTTPYTEHRPHVPRREASSRTGRASCVAYSHASEASVVPALATRRSALQDRGVDTWNRACQASSPVHADDSASRRGERSRPRRFTAPHPADTDGASRTPRCTARPCDDA
jgi:hypothetical protein